MLIIIAYHGLQVFARKLIRPFGALGAKDLQNEVRAVEKLCEPGSHKNIVSVLRHGRFPPLLYFIDMEVCELNLENYIHRKWPAEIVAKVPHFTNDVPARTRMSQVWEILEDITSGVAFIHLNKEIHRDLKPRNSTT